MKIKAKVTSSKRFTNKLKKLGLNIEKGQSSAVIKGILRIHEIAVKSVQDNSQGTIDIRYNPKRIVNVSAPGKPPNSDTGRGAQSIGFEFFNNNLRGIVGTGLKYMAILEFGSEKNKLQERPWLRPAAKKASKEIVQIHAEEVKKFSLRGLLNK